MKLEDVSAALVPVLARLRVDEPNARAFFLFGSLARGDHGAFSDVDVRVVTAGAPARSARASIFDVPVDGRVLPAHLSIGARAFESMQASARTPAGWPWIAGFVDVAVTLADADDVRGQLRDALVQPARLESESGLHSDLEDLIEHLAKTRNALARDDAVRVMRHAVQVARNARRALVPLAAVAPAIRGGELEERALATMPPAFIDDLRVCAGEVTHARDTVDVARAAFRVADAVVAKLASLEHLPLALPFAEDLVSGRVGALVQRMRA